MTTSQLLAMPFPAVGAIAAVLTGALARRIWAKLREDSELFTGELGQLRDRGG
jgi:hypothetical protein